jgi:GntR family transcriptional repressor for pyruvate dehydrogenase complex
MQNLFPKIGSTLTLSQEIVEKIEDVIRQKKVLPGEKLPTEKEMCTMFGVSRTALREALQMLSARGLVTIRKGSGIYVNNYSSTHVIKPMSLFLELNLDRDYIVHVMEVRKMFEPTIARLAAVNRTEKDVQKLEKNLEELKQSPSNNYYKQGQIDRDFHLIIAEACKNPIIPVIVTPIFKLMPKIRSLVYANIDTAKSEAVDYHIKIVDAIKASDADRAYQMMVEHLVVAERHSQKIMNEIE